MSELNGVGQSGCPEAQNDQPHCKYSIERGSNTPDFILAEYLKQCLETFDMCIRRREEWYGK